MARTRTISELISDVRALADVESETDRHPDSQLTRWINEGIADYRREFKEHFLTRATDTLTGGTATLALPSDYGEMYRVEITSSTVNKYVLHPYESAEAQDFNYGYIGDKQSLPQAYRIEGTDLRFIPTPDTNYSVTLVYLAESTDLVDTPEGETFDPRIDGGERWVVLYAARQVAIRDLSPRLSALDTEFSIVNRRLKATLPRNPGPGRRVDTRGRRLRVALASRHRLWEA